MIVQIGVADPPDGEAVLPVEDVSEASSGEDLVDVFGAFDAADLAEGVGLQQLGDQAPALAVEQLPAVGDVAECGLAFETRSTT